MVGVRNRLHQQLSFNWDDTTITAVGAPLGCDAPVRCKFTIGTLAQSELILQTGQPYEPVEFVSQYAPENSGIRDGICGYQGWYLRIFEQQYTPSSPTRY